MDHAANHPYKLTCHLQSNVFLRDIWKPRPYIAAGNYTRETAFEDADKYGDLIAFGRLFIPNVGVFSLSSREYSLSLCCSPTYPCGLRRTSLLRRAAATYTMCRRSRMVTSTTPSRMTPTLDCDST